MTAPRLQVRFLFLLMAVAAIPLRAAGTQAMSMTGSIRDEAPADRQQIVELARKVGMQEPASVSSEMIGLPIGCFVVQVQSALSIDGPRRRWTEFNAIPTESTRSANYCDIRASTDAVRVGRWVGGTLVQREVWRVQDGGWHLDVVLEGVDYATASRIVLAVAQKTFVDRRRDDTSKVVGKDDHITGAYLGAAGSEYRFTALLNGGWESQTLYLTGAERVELHRLERRVS